MNREILFRGKRVDNGEWGYGYYCKSCGRLNGGNYDFHSIYDYDDDFLGGENFEVIPEYEIIPETLGQYIGLTDKNGRRIFEGDIIKRGNNKYVVRWSNKDCAMFALPRAPFEVIGNIHDNPELLGGETNDR